MKTTSKNTQQQERPVWTNEVRYISLVGLIILIIYIAYLIRGSLTLLVLAALVAYLISPIVRFFNRKLRIKRNLAIILAYILLLIVIIIGISFIIPRVTQAVRDFLAVDWPQVLSAFDEYIGLLEDEVDAVQITAGGFTLDLSEPLKKLQETIRSFRAEAISVESLIPDMSETLRRLFSFSTGIFGQIITGLILTITAVMASIYFSRDGNKLGGYVVNLFEEKYQPEIRELLHRIRLVWDRYFAGELKLMLYIGLITFLAYGALGIRWALVLGVIAGFCEVVPNIGPILATIPAFVSALIFGSRWFPLNNVAVAVIAVIVAVIIQQTENIFLVPHIMGNALELHPVVVLIGIVALSSRMGLLGAVFAAPLIALSKEVLYFIVTKIKRDDPYPEIYKERS